MLTPGHDVAGVAETEVMAFRVKEVVMLTVGTIFLGTNFRLIKLYFVLEVDKPVFIGRY